MKEPKAMQEIHAIREQMSRERRGLTAAERTALVKANMERLQKEFGFKIIDKIPEPLYAETN